MDIRTAQFVHLSVDLGMYPWQTFHNSSASIGEEKNETAFWEIETVFFLEEGSEGSQESIRSNHAAVKNSYCHEVET